MKPYLLLCLLGMGMTGCGKKSLDGLPTTISYEVLDGNERTDYEILHRGPIVACATCSMQRFIIAPKNRPHLPIPKELQ